MKTPMRIALALATLVGSLAWLELTVHMFLILVLYLLLATPVEIIVAVLCGVCFLFSAFVAVWLGLTAGRCLAPLSRWIAIGVMGVAVIVILPTFPYEMIASPTYAGLSFLDRYATWVTAPVHASTSYLLWLLLPGLLGVVVYLLVTKREDSQLDEGP